MDEIHLSDSVVQLFCQIGFSLLEIFLVNFLKVLNSDFKLDVVLNAGGFLLVLALFNAGENL